MKILKYIFTLIAVGIISFVLFGFVMYMKQPNPPKTILKIDGNEWNISNEFHEFNTEFWGKDDDKLVFNNQSDLKEAVTLNSNLVPSEHKKDGYVTMSVKVPGNFDLLADDAVFGFQIGEVNASENEQLILGLNGTGEIIVVNGELEPLVEEKVKGGKYFTNNSSEEEIELSFHYYKNPYGWVLFFNAKNEKESIGKIVNYIPFEKLNSLDKELSLIAFNPSKKGKLWFKDWSIQNDWTPND